MCFPIKISHPPQAGTITENDFIRLVVHGSRFLYLCGEGHTCGLEIVLISDAKTFKHNFDVYKRMLESLSKNSRKKS